MMITMKCKLEKASDSKFSEDIELNTIEDLFNIANKYEEIIVSIPWSTSEKEEYGLIILIYDDYVE